MYNLSHLLLRGHTNLPVGGHHKTTFILHKSVLRGTSHFFFPELPESFKDQAASPAGEGGGVRYFPKYTCMYKLYRYVMPRRVWLLRHFGLKTGIDFDHYGLKSGVVFKGTMRASLETYWSFQLQMNSMEREASKIYHLS